MYIYINDIHFIQLHHNLTLSSYCDLGTYAAYGVSAVIGTHCHARPILLRCSAWMILDVGPMVGKDSRNAQNVT